MVLCLRYSMYKMYGAPRTKIYRKIHNIEFSGWGDELANNPNKNVICND